MNRKGWGWGSVVECLPVTQETLVSSPTPQKKKKKKKGLVEWHKW
jgi:hypothetical protein